MRSKLFDSVISPCSRPLRSFHWYLAIIYQPEHILLPPPILKRLSTCGRRNSISRAANRPLKSLITAKPLSKQSFLKSKSNSTDIKMHSDSMPKSREASPSASDYGRPGISTGLSTPDVVMDDVVSTSSGRLFDRDYDVATASGPGASPATDMDVDISDTGDDQILSSSSETKSVLLFAV